MTGHPPGPFAIVFFEPYLLLCCQLLRFFLPVALFFLAFLPACFLAVKPSFCRRANELSGAHAYTVATCEVPILRPQLEHIASKKTAA